MDSGTFGESPLMLGDTQSEATLQQRITLRRQLRQRRRTLTVYQQKQAARQLSQSLQRHPRIQQAKHVAAYVANDGEINPAPFMLWAQRHDKTLWLPVVNPAQTWQKQALRFVRAPKSRHPRGWRRNRYGIWEPWSRHSQPAHALSVLLMPLVGFDASGNRLGMGGGYYDRLLANLNRRPQRPYTIGLAHTCQQVDTLPIAPWDCPVDELIAV